MSCSDPGGAQIWGPGPGSQLAPLPQVVFLLQLLQARPRPRTEGQRSSPLDVHPFRAPRPTQEAGAAGSEAGAPGGRVLPYASAGVSCEGLRGPPSGTLRKRLPDKSPSWLPPDSCTWATSARDRKVFTSGASVSSSVKWGDGSTCLLGVLRQPPESRQVQDWAPGTRSCLLISVVAQMGAASGRVTPQHPQGPAPGCLPWNSFLKKRQ